MAVRLHLHIACINCGTEPAPVEVTVQWEAASIDAEWTCRECGWDNHCNTQENGEA